MIDVFVCGVFGFELFDIYCVKFMLDLVELEKCIYFMYCCNVCYYSFVLFEMVVLFGCVYVMVEVDLMDEVGCVLDCVVVYDVKMFVMFGWYCND